MRRIGSRFLSLRRTLLCFQLLPSLNVPKRSHLLPNAIFIHSDLIRPQIGQQMAVFVADYEIQNNFFCT